MAIGVAVDILGCTGSVEERATTLNRIILVALELKDTVGDLFAFTALMKALDLPQVTHCYFFPFYFTFISWKLISHRETAGHVERKNK